jgi:hypothetical protein
MHYSTVADIHAMMVVTSTRGGQVGAERRFLLESQWPLRAGPMPSSDTLAIAFICASLRRLAADQLHLWAIEDLGSYSRIARSSGRISFVLALGSGAAKLNQLGNGCSISCRL